MSIHSYLLSGSYLKKAKQLTFDARQEKGEKADQLFQQAYNSFTAISESYSNYADALYYWGFALLYQAQTKSAEEAIKTFEEAINKFSCCKTIVPNHLGAAIDGGVALLGLAKAKQIGLDHELYHKAKESFGAAEKIQAGSASYNLACIYALQNEESACLKALENARDHGLVPDEQDILNDNDLKNIKQLTWFAEYINSLTTVTAETIVEEIKEKSNEQGEIKEI
ncbi:MAG: hypothetical protein GQ529_00120 [Methyloprofundus sp.]|nr:hypothetical protein [Methyloprofundus sp.]